MRLRRLLQYPGAAMLAILPSLNTDVGQLRGIGSDDGCADDGEIEHRGAALAMRAGFSSDESAACADDARGWMIGSATVPGRCSLLGSARASG